MSSRKKMGNGAADSGAAGGGKIVVFGATGYTGELVARALVARGARPLLAARSAGRLQALAQELGGLDTQVADVAQPASVQALLARGDVLVSTVGPFVRYGEPAVQAAIAAGATYLDSTGEPPFIRRVFEHHHRAAVAARVALLTAFGYDWVPGNLAGALALREAGAKATRVEIGYFSRGGGLSGGTRASMVGALLDPSFAWRGGRLVAERGTARARGFEVAPGKRKTGATVGGSEHFGLPAIHPTLRDVEVFLGVANAERMPLVSGVVAAATRLPGVRPALHALAARAVKGSTGGPDAAARAASTSTIVAEAFAGKSWELLSQVKLEGVNGYTFTAEILAWAAMTALAGGVTGTGALGPVSAFGLDALEQGVKQAGLARA